MLKRTYLSQWLNDEKLFPGFIFVSFLCFRYFFVCSLVPFAKAIFPAERKKHFYFCLLIKLLAPEKNLVLVFDMGLTQHDYSFICQAAAAG